MPRLLRVLSVTPAFLPHRGGLGQMVFELAQRVRHHAVLMDVVHVAPEYDQASEETMNGVRVYRLPLRGSRVLGFAPGLAKIVRQYDLVHAHDPQLLAITQNLMVTNRATPAVLSTHGGFWHTQQHAWIKRLYERTVLRNFLNHYERVLASSEADYSYYRALTDRAVLCSNGVPVEHFGSVPSLDVRPLTRWIYWGRLSRNKRLERVIDTVAVARRLGHPVELLICGQDFDGLKPRLQQRIERRGLQEHVRIEGERSDADLLKELATRGVYITASEHEGFGISVVEAMAAGLVVLCRDLSPLNGLVKRGQTGDFLRFDNSQGDRQVLDRVLSMPAVAARAWSAAARQAAQPHDWRFAAKRFARHYRDVLAAVEEASSILDAEPETDPPR